MVLLVWGSGWCVLMTGRAGNGAKDKGIEGFYRRLLRSWAALWVAVWLVLSIASLA
jgi:hypothetical protein